jgi:hypothetical protein
LFLAAYFACRHTGANGGSGLGVAATYSNPSSRCKSNSFAIFNGCPDATYDLAIDVTAPYRNPFDSRCCGNRWVIADDRPNTGRGDIYCTSAALAGSRRPHAHHRGFRQ